MNNFAVIFDVDGTFANGDHREHFIMTKPKNWPAYEAMAHLDTLHEEIHYIYSLFKNAGHPILIASGRHDGQRTMTMNWLNNNGIFFDAIYMRREGDYRSDDIIKMELLDQMRQDGWDPKMVFDDRQRVVDAWRRAGLRCFQVAPGDF